MNNQLIITTNDLNGKHLDMAAMENEQKQLRAETLEWISLSALSRLRVAWGS